MQTLLKIASAAFLMFLNCNEANAQSKKKDDSFPTYDQIRGNKKETVDYVSPNGSNATTHIVRKTTIGPHLNAFAYDEDSVTYVLNGKKVKSKKKAEYEVNRKDIRVERISIGEVGKEGKRVIEIDYEPFKE